MQITHQFTLHRLKTVHFYKIMIIGDLVSRRYPLRKRNIVKEWSLVDTRRLSCAVVGRLTNNDSTGNCPNLYDVLPFSRQQRCKRSDGLITIALTFRSGMP